MDNTFELKRGKLVFEQDKIVITDDAKRQKRARILSALFLLVMGAYEIYRFTQKSEDQFLRSGLMVIGVGLILIVLALLVNVQNEIDLKEVKSLAVKRIFFKELLLIKLKNNRTRQVAGIYNAERLETYIQTISLPDNLT